MMLSERCERVRAKLKQQCFQLRWSDEDGEWVCTCDRYPSLSYVDHYPSEALRGLMGLVWDELLDEFIEGKP
jgi:hypothetical protein